VARTHAGAVNEELQPVGRTHIGEDCGELSPMRRTSRWSSMEECEEPSPCRGGSGRDNV